MYDKIKFWLPRIAGMEQFAPLRSKIVEADRAAFSTVDASTGEVKILFRGRLENLQITEFLAGVSVIGSINKWANGGTNLFNMSLGETKDSLDELSEVCQTNLRDIHVSALEFGYNFEMKHDIGRYLRLLGDMPRRVRKSVNDETLYYTRKGRERDTLTFYNKVKEAARKKMPMPQGYEGLNLLRAELRLTNGISALLREPEVSGETLTEERFINKLINMMCEKYDSIQKQARVNLAEIKAGGTEREYLNLYLSVLANLVGDKFTPDEFLAILRDKKVFSNKTQYSRLKKKFSEVISNVSLTEKDPLLEELNAKFEELRDMAKNQTLI